MDEDLQQVDTVEEETEQSAADFPWVLFSIEDVIYGIFSTHVLSIEIMGDTTSLVNSPEYTRGITNFRGDMISLIDLRVLFGLPNKMKEFLATLVPLIESHHKWVRTLDECIHDKKHFPLATDPHLCAFGKWFYLYTTKNSVLDLYIKKVEAPHVRVHETGAKIMQLVEDDNQAEAERLYKDVVLPAYHEVLAWMDGLAAAYREGSREMLVVLEVNGMVKGIIVDEIVSVEYLDRMLDMAEISEKTKYVRNLAKREKDNSTVQLMDEELMIKL